MLRTALVMLPTGCENKYCFSGMSGGLTACSHHVGGAVVAVFNKRFQLLLHQIRSYHNPVTSVVIPWSKLRLSTNEQ